VPAVEPNQDSSIPSLGYPQVILKPRKARPFYGRHPWVLSSAVARVIGDPQDGDVVDLFSDHGKWIARGLFHGRSQIQVRLYTWMAGQELDMAFWRARFQRAVTLRRKLSYLDDDGACRLVNSEGDGLGGLIVDRYGPYVVAQFTSLGMARRLETWLEILSQELPCRGILARTERQFAKTEGIEIAEGLVWGESPPAPFFVNEHGIRYGVDLTSGQKTGLYLDQRENRRAAAHYLGGLHVLDLFCYAGGFALTASRLGAARHVLAVDSSNKAIEWGKANGELNEIANVRFEAGEAFDTLDKLYAAREKFDAVILDPPKFAASQESLEKALAAYHRINRCAVGLLNDGGILVTCSCTGRVTPDDFETMLSGVAQKSAREIQILEKRGAAPDHPIFVTTPEGEYLKCFICRVL
jgi:23S rRNA (cytosine1962-C5)-methyltransferase